MAYAFKPLRDSRRSRHPLHGVDERVAVVQTVVLRVTHRQLRAVGKVAVPCLDDVIRRISNCCRQVKQIALELQVPASLALAGKISLSF